MPRKPKPEGQHVAVYARASSDTQKTASQEPDLTRWAAAQALPVVWYRDKFTGTTMDRPGWSNLWQSVKAGKVATVVCWRIDRLGRTAVGLTQLFADLKAGGVNLVSVREGLDLSTPAGHMVAIIMAAQAQYETEVRSERQRAGIDAARAAGVAFGRPSVGVGRGKRISVTPEQVDQVRRLAAGGASKAAIARATGLSRPTIYSVLADDSAGTE